MDGPGAGEAIRFRNMPLRHDYEKAGGACIDYLQTRGDVDAKRIGIVAISLGGYYAPRCAALEPRFAACIAWGAIWDYYGTWKKRIDAGFKASMSVPGEDDEQIPLKDAQALYDASGSTDKTLRVFTAEEGGAQHCQRDYLSLGTATMWNWFEDKLVSRAD